VVYGSFELDSQFQQVRLWTLHEGAGAGRSAEPDGPPIHVYRRDLRTLPSTRNRATVVQREKVALSKANAGLRRIRILKDSSRGRLWRATSENGED
jgi:hypothetical protein